MATSPAFASTPHIGAAIAPATNDTSLTAPTNVATVLSGGSSGTKVEEVDVVGLGTTVAGRLNLFLYDGSTYHLFDQVLITAITPSSTAEVFRQSNLYANLFIPSGWSLRATVMETGNESLLKVIALGGDF